MVRNKAWAIGFVALVVTVLPIISEASPLLSCPDAVGGTTGYNRQFWLDPATACVWGTGFVNNDKKDDFLDGSGILDGLNPSAILGLSTTGADAGWTNVSYNFDNDSETDANWLIPGYDPLKEYLVGIKAGGNPDWALFLVSESSGTWGTVPADAWSHAVLYSRSRSDVQIASEPASLLLLGSGLAVAGHRFRRHRQAQKG